VAFRQPKFFEARKVGAAGYVPRGQPRRGRGDSRRMRGYPVPDLGAVTALIRDYLERARSGAEFSTRRLDA
jgi:hypothetical protein